MDGFDFIPARSPSEAVTLYSGASSAAYIAGGTDLVPNLKHRIVRPERLVGLAGALPTGWTITDTDIRIGAGTRLAALTRLAELPALARAASLIASPQIRNMGTIGGNVFLDTRCVFYNQTESWRRALGYCLKAEGDWCHVIGSARTCVASQSSDLVPVLMALDATLGLLGPAGERRLALRDLFVFNGMKHLKITPGELLTHIDVPRPPPGHRGWYDKVRVRDSIDFPLLGVAITGVFDGEGANCVARSLDIVVGAINPAPRPLKGLAAFVGRALDDAALKELSALARKQSKAQGSLQGPVPSMEKWRRVMVGLTVARGLRAVTQRS